MQKSSFPDTCQSCGMPMAAVEHFGTNPDRSHNNDYCCFCYKEGHFTDNFSFDQFVLDLLQFHDEDEKNEGCTISKEEFELKARTTLPTLKRWKTHQHTHLEYYKSVNRAVDYISSNLANDITLSEVADTACISYFHFHRIFKAIMNESPGDYIQRLRLEKAAFNLLVTKLTLSEIAEQTGYQSLHALSKAFKKRFGVSPSEYRKKSTELTTPLREPIDNLHVEAKITEIKPIEVLYTRVINPFIDEMAFQVAWQNLLHYSQTNGIPDTDHQYYCLSRDISTITSPDQCRTYVCLNTSKQVKASGRFGKQIIEGGTYAVFTHKGSYKKLNMVYSNIYRFWIPNSDYELRDNISFEKYFNNPHLTCEDDLLTEIYIPITRL